MHPLITQIHKLLLKRKKTIAVAESCTGGLVSEHLTLVSGSSKYFILGVVAYSNRAKMDVLRVPGSLISRYQAVSKETALSIAKNIRKIARTDLGLGITGIAGPTGGTSEKPIGTVFIAIYSQTRSFCKKFHFRGSRLTIRKKAALKALELLKRMV